MLSWFTSKSAPRPVDILLDSNAVYDLTFLEWEQRQILLQLEKVYVCVQKSRNKIKKPYELLFKKDRLSIYSLYRNRDKEPVVALFESVKTLLNTVSEGIVTKKPTVIAPILRDIVDSIRNHPNWTSAHIAAKVGLDKLFIKKYTHIMVNLNAQTKPDLLTPLHLVIQSERLTATKAVLALNPDMNLKDKKGNYAVHYAAMSGREILDLILKDPKMFEMLGVKNRKGCTPFHLACFASKTDNVLELLQYGLTIHMMTVPPPDNKVKYDCDDKKRICFTKEDIEDLDTEDMRFGGTPLHWVKHRRTLEKLIAYGFRLDVTNANGETALHTMVKRLRLKCMIGLLCYGAGVEQSDRAGDTPLHCAVKLADVTTSQALIIFDSDIDVKNKYKESPRHCATTGKHADHHLVLYVLTAIGAKRCDSNMKGCESGCAHNGNFEGKPYYKWPTYENESFYKEVLLEPIVREALLRKKEGTDQKSKPVRIICFDGGGIRGLITIQLLIEMEKQLKYPIANYFEWMAGTSTGSIIAMLLATGRSLREGRKVYFRLKDKIFVGSRPYSAKNFEKLLEDELGSELKMCDIRQTFDKKVIVNATLIDRNPAQLHVFRSYESPEEILGLPQAPPGFKIYPGCKDQIAWKACRASGAAPTYFSASDAFLDGGLIANNPTLDALTEFRLYNNSLKAVGRSEEAQELDLIVSFGTGRHPIIQEEPIDVVRMWTFNPKEIHKNTLYIKQMGNLLVNEATATEGHIVDRAQSWCSWIKTPYFRINPQLSEVLGLDETSDVEICNALWESKAYMYAMRHNVNIIVQLMSSPQETQPKIDIKSDKNSINSQTNFGSQSETGFSVSLPFSEIKIQSEIPTI